MGDPQNAARLLRNGNYNGWRFEDAWLDK